MRVRHSLAQPWTLQGTDLDDARELYQNEYNGRDFAIDPSDRPFQYRLSAVGDEQLSLRSNTVYGRMRGTYMITGEYVVTWFTEGAGVLDVGRREQVMSVGVPVVSVQNRPSQFQVCNHRQSLVHIGADYLEQLASAIDGTHGPLRFDDDHLPAPEQTQAWMTAIAHAARVLHDPNATTLMLAEAKHTTAAAMLATFPHESSTDLPAPLRARSVRVRRAVEYIRAFAHEPLEIGAIADAAGLTIRGVQDAFRRHLDMAPLEYLRQVRLERVHVELLGATHKDTTVTTVARRWGLTHPGRFAGYYASHYGEHPSTTLRRRTPSNTALSRA